MSIILLMLVVAPSITISATTTITAGSSLHSETSSSISPLSFGGNNLVAHYSYGVDKESNGNIVPVQEKEEGVGQCRGLYDVKPRAYEMAYNSVPSIYKVSENCEPVPPEDPCKDKPGMMLWPGGGCVPKNCDPPSRNATGHCTGAGEEGTGGLDSKPGTDLSNMSDKITDKYDEINDVFNEHTGQDGTITSGRDGKHGTGSLHYSGEAIDLRTRGLSDSQVNDIVNDLRDTLGNDYDVVNEHNKPGAPHIHIEYDP